MTPSSTAATPAVVVCELAFLVGCGGSPGPGSSPPSSSLAATASPLFIRDAESNDERRNAGYHPTGRHDANPRAADRRTLQSRRSIAVEPAECIRGSSHPHRSIRYLNGRMGRHAACKLRLWRCNTRGFARGSPDGVECRSWNVACARRPQSGRDTSSGQPMVLHRRLWSRWWSGCLRKRATVLPDRFG